MASGAKRLTSIKLNVRGPDGVSSYEESRDWKAG